MDRILGLLPHLPHLPNHPPRSSRCLIDRCRHRREPENLNDAFAVCVLRNEEIVGHIKKGDNGRFARTIFYFLRAAADNRCRATVRGMPVNHRSLKLIFQIPHAF